MFYLTFLFYVLEWLEKFRKENGGNALNWSERTRQHSRRWATTFLVYILSNIEHSLCFTLLHWCKDHSILSPIASHHDLLNLYVYVLYQSYVLIREILWIEHFKSYKFSGQFSRSVYYHFYRISSTPNTQNQMNFTRKWTRKRTEKWERSIEKQKWGE